MVLPRRPFYRILPLPKKGRNCKTNPISFTTFYLSITNNEKFSISFTSKSYDDSWLMIESVTNKR
jgi:hypothetical protein